MKYAEEFVIVSFVILLAGVAIFTIVTMGACTYNMGMAHTEVSASDVIGHAQSPQNIVSPNLQVPGLK